MFLSSNLRFVRENSITGSDRDAAEGGDGLAVEFLDTKQDVGFVHRLEVEVGADDAVAVDYGTAHVCADGRGVTRLYSTCRDRGGRQPIQCSHEKVDQVRGRDAGQLSYIHVADPRHVAPITLGKADLPFEVFAVGLVGVAYRVGDRPLTHVTLLQAGQFAFREDRVVCVDTPGHHPDGGVGVGGAATIEDVVGGLGVGCGLGGVAWGKASEAFRVYQRVAIDDGLGDLLGHPLQKCTRFGEPELWGVTVEVGDVFVDHRVGFKIAAGVDDLSSRRLGIGDTAVEEAPCGLGDTGSDGGLVSCRAVAFDDHHVIEDFICLREEFDDGCDFVAVVHTLGPIRVGKCG